MRIDWICAPVRPPPVTPTTTEAVGSPAAVWNSWRDGMAISTRAEVMPRMVMMVRASSPSRARFSFRFCWNSVWPSTDWLSKIS